MEISRSKKRKFAKYFSACLECRCDVANQTLEISKEEGDILAKIFKILIMKKDGHDYYVNPKLSLTRKLIEANNVWSDAHNFYSTMAELCHEFRELGMIEKQKDGREYVCTDDILEDIDGDFCIYPDNFDFENQDCHTEAVVASMIASFESRINKRLDEINSKLDHILFNTDK